MMKITDFKKIWGLLKLEKGEIDFSKKTQDNKIYFGIKKFKEEELKLFHTILILTDEDFVKESKYIQEQIFQKKVAITANIDLLEVLFKDHFYKNVYISFDYNGQYIMNICGNIKCLNLE